MLLTLRHNYVDVWSVCVITFRTLTEKERQKKCTKSQVKISQRQKFETDELHSCDEI